MDIEDKDLVNPFFIVKKRSEWYQCARCYSDLRVREHANDCSFTLEQQQAATRHVQHIIKAFHNTKGVEVLKGGK